MTYLIVTLALVCGACVTIATDSYWAGLAAYLALIAIRFIAQERTVTP